MNFRHLLLSFVAGLSISAAAPQSGRYALILSDAPAARDNRAATAAAQLTLSRELDRRDLRITGSVQTLMNAVFVQASKDQVALLRALPGVQSVVPVRMMRRLLDKAVQLQNVPAAWTALGGTSNAGAGVKIAILDTGIDQTHPAFQDSSLTVPAGFPKCQGSDCAFTNNKVIVARSYVNILAAGSPSNPAADSRPDDLSPRDRIGHGTALGMISAGVTNAGPATTITGVAPKAWLGNYKVFGSPGVNDYTGGDVIAQALEDAYNDGMDIAVLSLGGPAFFGPLDQGSQCGNAGSDPCDFEAYVVERAIRAGLTVVVAAGNEGDTGINDTTRNTISSPATAPSAIAAGASTNGHAFVSSIRIHGGGGIPASLQSMPALYGDGPKPVPPLTAPLRDVAALDGTGNTCSALPAGSLTGTIALVLRTPNLCSFAVKVTNASAAGAVGVIIIQAAGQGPIFNPGGLAGTPIPAAMITDADGASLKAYVASNAGTQATLDTTIRPFDTTSFNTVASFSSRGPSINYLLKPEMLAVGTDMYMATQRFDPDGEMYDTSGYTVADGTSFSAPTVAGAAALVKQKNPRFTPAQLKSALVNSATQDITENGDTASVLAAGNGKLNGGAAVQSTLTADPATLSFGALDAQNRPPLSRTLTLRYTGSTPAALTLAVARTGNSGTLPVLDKTSLSFSPGQADQTVTLTLGGDLPAAGAYEGAVTIQGAGSTVRIPYLFLVGDGLPFEIVPLSGFGFDGAVDQTPVGGILAFRVIDRYGVGVSGLPVLFSVDRGGGSFRNADIRTGAYGLATAEPILGPTPGSQRFLARVAGWSIPFTGNARLAPAISSGGIVNAASFQAGPGIVPGSYISIFGSDLSDGLDLVSTLSLPLGLGGVTVSFDIPSARISLPGRLIFVSPNQVNVQVPWELPANSQVQMKVSIGFTPGQVSTAQVAAASPAIYVREGIAAALDAGNRVITSANPARRGQTVQIYLNGLGQVDNRPATGEPAPSQPLARTLATPTVTIGGVPASLQFSGLAPGFAGLNQVNVVVPANVSAGSQPVIVSQGGVASPPVNLPVQ